MSFLPTAEQQTARDAFATGGNMVIEAGAGTGKTSTLRLLAEDAPQRKGLYLAYNKTIQLEAEASFPSSVKCKTAHSLAYGPIVMGKGLRHRLNGPRVTSRDAVAILGIKGSYEVNAEQSIPAWMIASQVMQMVGRFCTSADRSITSRHAALLPGLEKSDQRAFAKFLVPFADIAWADLQSPDGKLKFDHNHYLKMWALTNPKLNYDFILFDEAQDANPVIAGVVQAQTCQKIMVGDRCQAIYGWNGAVDAMSSFEADHRVLLSKSFRFGQAIADQANLFLTRLNSPLRLEGFESIPSVVEIVAEPDAILCRTNAECIAQAMSFQAQGKRVAIAGGTTQIKMFTESARDLMDGKTPSHADLIAFKTWADVVEYAASDEGADLRVLVRLISTYGVDAILEVCATSVKEDRADIVISTAHKAKGREWDKVRLGNDFASKDSDGEPKELGEAEIMLLYVSVTRARLVLDCSALTTEEVVA